MSIHYQIEILEPLGAELSRHQLEAGRYMLGRASDCDVVLGVSGLSRRHLSLEVLADGGAVIEDQGSTNGTRLDGRVVCRAAVAGDFVLDLGAAVLRFRALDPALGDLAYRTDQPSAHDTSAERDPEPATAALNLNEALRQDLWRACETLPDATPLLQRVLPAWRESLRARTIALHDGAGQTLAIQGDPGTPLEETCSNEHYALLLDQGCPSARLAAEQLGLLLDWLPPRPDSETQVKSSTAIESFPGVWPSDPELQRQFVALARVAGSAVSILLLGETGTGKDLLAKWIHACSPRSDGPFIAINCAALPQDLLEAELFGIEAGAATGVSARPGVFERAHGGTLFLDELGEMPADTQVRLLRVLEDGSLYRIGGSELRPVDIRLVSATNRDLEAAIDDRAFRLDLFHRLAAFETRVPALRERPDDIASLAIHFFNAALAANGQRSPGMTRQALMALQQWHWPGNIRELKQAVDSATALLHPGEALDQSHLPQRLSGLTLDPRSLTRSEEETHTLADAVAAAEARAIRAALRASDGVPETAWTMLGIGKTTFYKKLKELEIDPDSEERTT